MTPTREGASKVIEVDGRRIVISNAHKVLFPDDGITEGDLAVYYAAIAQVGARMFAAGRS